MAGLVDISIKNFKEILDSPKKLERYMKEECLVTQKSDGVKIVLFFNKKAEWEVWYKDHRIHEAEFDGFDSNDTKGLKNSSGYAQYIQIFNHLKKIDSTKIPKNTKFFCEFIMRKPTLTRSYKILGSLVLLSINDNWNDKETERYAKILKVRTPEILAKGKFETEILPNLDKFLKIESVFGGKEEGIILTFTSLKEKFKILQNDQHDKDLRKSIKAKFYDTPEYYEKVNKILKSFDLENTKIDWDFVKSLKLPESTKLTKIQQQEDALERALKLKKIQKDGIGLILGKFRIFTKEHENLINKALKDDSIKKVVVCLVSGKETEFSRNLRMRMLLEFQRNSKILKKFEIIEHSSGNLFSIFKKLGNEPLKLFCGTDRLESYRNMLKSNFTEVIETKRTADDISATQALKHLDSQKELEKFISPKIKSLIPDLKSLYLTKED